MARGLFMAGGLVGVAVAAFLYGMREDPNVVPMAVWLALAVLPLWLLAASAAVAIVWPRYRL